MLELKTNQNFAQRNRLSIMVLLLENCYSGSRKTHLMCKCNLNLDRFNKYMNLLIESGLLEKSIERSPTKRPIELYTITKKGVDFLRNYQKISPIIDQIT